MGMEPEAFEQLVSEWLDQRGREELRARIEAEVARAPELGRVRDEWLRLDTLLHAARLDPARIDWPRLRQRLLARLQAADGDSVDATRVRELTDISGRIDWTRLRRRIADRVDQAGGAPRVIRSAPHRIAAGLGLLAAAAALVLMFVLPAGRAARPLGIARVHVAAPAAPLRADGGPPLARVAISVAPAAESAAHVAAVPAGQAHLAEVFLMIEPLRAASEVRGSPAPFHLY